MLSEFFKSHLLSQHPAQESGSSQLTSAVPVGHTLPDLQPTGTVFNHLARLPACNHVVLCSLQGWSPPELLRGKSAFYGCLYVAQVG